MKVFILNSNMLAKLIFVSVFSAIYCSAITSTSRQGSLNTYLCYTRNNPLIEFVIPANIDNSAGTPLNPDLNTAIIVHGHEGDGFTTLNPLVKNYYLDKVDSNVIVVDWSSYSKLSYSNAVAAVPSVGDKLGEFLGLMITQGRLKYENLHLIGFGLGAHVVGFAGRKLGGNAARITGLDPAGSQWGSGTPRLSKSDAKYVEVIHTDGGGLLSNGIGTALGHVDFFVNGGSNQPGCFTHTCCHNRAFELFAGTLSKEEQLFGRRCTSSLQISLNRCSSNSLHIGGEDLVKLLAVEGSYRVNTGRNFPFY